MIVVLAIGYETPIDTIFNNFTQNTIFKTILALQLIIIVVYFGLSTAVFMDWDSTKTYYPNWQIWVLSFVSVLIVILFEEVTKIKVRTLFERDH